MIKKIAFAAVAACALTTATAASAQVFVTGSIGPSRASLDCSGTDSCKNGGTGLILMGGYRFTPNVAVEAGYLDFGKARASVSGIRADLKTTGWGAGLAFQQDLPQDWRVGLRLGVASMQGKISLLGVSDSEHTTEAYAGFFGGYKLTPVLSIDGRVDFSRGKYVDGYTVRLFSIGATYGF